MLAYHAAVNDQTFDGRLSLLQPMTLGGRVAFELMIRGKAPKAGPRSAPVNTMSPGAARRKMTGDASDDALSFWFTPDSAHG